MKLVSKPEAILIAGPTASGKSKVALKLAAEQDGEIINADSMQVYPVLNVLTARPDPQDLATVPHHLYGHTDITAPYSVARWLADMKPVHRNIINRGKIPIFVGGTGLYFSAMLDGLSAVPEIPTDIREQVRGDMLREGPELLHQRLTTLDPAGAARLKSGDSHRIARALEVVVATGKPLSHFHNQRDERPFLAGISTEKVLLMPERSALRERINRRTDVMLEQGAIAEVEALMALDLPADATVLRAIGVPQLRDYILGKQSLDDCRDKLKAATRQYAKRQSTWFRNQLGNDWRLIDKKMG